MVTDETVSFNVEKKKMKKLGKFLKRYIRL